MKMKLADARETIQIDFVANEVYFDYRFNSFVRWEIYDMYKDCGAVWR